MRYIKVDLDLFEEIGDFRQCGIICFLLNQNKEKDKVKYQKWKQTELAKIFKVTPRTIYNDLQKLQKEGWLIYKESFYKNLKTTQIELTENALKWFEDKQIINIKSNTRQPTQNYDNDEFLQKAKSESDKYLEYINKQIN